MFNNIFPELNHADIAFENVSFALNFSPSPGNPNVFEFNNTFDPSFAINANTFYLIKGITISSSVPKDIYETLQFYQGGDLKTPFVGFNFLVVSNDQNNNGVLVNKVPITFGDYGRFESFYRFSQSTESNYNENQVLRILPNSNPRFKVTPEFTAAGITDLTLNVKLELYSVSATWWIKKYWERGATPGQAGAYTPGDSKKYFESLDKKGFRDGRL